jgi:hypothetical protein
MNNKKQTAVELFIEQLEKKGDPWENSSMNQLHITIDIDDYLELKIKAKEMEKEQIEDAYQEGYSQGYAKCEQAEDYYYEQTYGGNN